MSPRPNSPQKKISNVSLGSVSDLFGPESPTRPGPPRSRASNLSIMSTESAFSVVSCCFVWREWFYDLLNFNWLWDSVLSFRELSVVSKGIVKVWGREGCVDFGQRCRNRSM